MFEQKTVKYYKVEVKLKGKESEVDDGLIQSVPSTTVLSFDDAGLVITGDYLIVVIDEKDDINETLSSTGKIFNLSQVISYKTHNP